MLNTIQRYPHLPPCTSPAGASPLVMLSKNTTTPSTRKAGRPSVPVPKKSKPCDICGKVLSRAADLPRHMKTHDPDAMKYPCDWENCNYSSLQNSNLEAHKRTHQEKPFDCTLDDKCEFRSCNQSSQIRHEKEALKHADKRVTPRVRRAPRRPRRSRARRTKGHKAGESSSAATTASSESGIQDHTPIPPPETTTPSLDYVSLYHESTSMPFMDSCSDLPLLFSGSPPPCNSERDSTMSYLAENGFFDFMTPEPDTEQLLTTSEQY